MGCGVLLSPLVPPSAPPERLPFEVRGGEVIGQDSEVEGDPGSGRPAPGFLSHGAGVHPAAVQLPRGSWLPWTFPVCEEMHRDHHRAGAGLGVCLTPPLWPAELPSGPLPLHLSLG